MLKRLFDIVFSFFAIIVLSPLLLIISLLVLFSSRGGIFYCQKRVGRHNRDFLLFKFRSMRPGSDNKGLLTIGGRDPRITPIGYFIRKYKLDELPQLFNVLIGDMSLVGPRPEVRRYVDMYNEDQKKILDLRPGITDYASMKYFTESELLAQSDDPEKTYIEKVMPAKLELNKKYMRDAGFVTDLKIIAGTVRRIFSH
jgi:lipopolysaccharide/colanic/teichoic acid biosynthesis glycosyltransferase